MASVPARLTYSLWGLWGCRFLDPLGSPTHGTWVFVFTLFWPVGCYSGFPFCPSCLAIGLWVLQGSALTVTYLFLYSVLSMVFVFDVGIFFAFGSSPQQCISFMIACCSAGNLACDVYAWAFMFGYVVVAQLYVCLGLCFSFLVWESAIDRRCFTCHRQAKKHIREPLETTVSDDGD